MKKRIFTAICVMVMCVCGGMMLTACGGDTEEIDVDTYGYTVDETYKKLLQGMTFTEGAVINGKYFGMDTAEGSMPSADVLFSETFNVNGGSMLNLSMWIKLSTGEVVYFGGYNNDHKSPCSYVVNSVSGDVYDVTFTFPRLYHLKTYADNVTMHFHGKIGTAEMLEN